MSLMDVFVKIGADTSGLESGISKAKGLAGGLGSAVSAGLKVAGAAIGAATTGVVAFAKSAVEAGKTFDSSMAQVAATMGVTVDEIGELRDFAQEMGAKTAFSATQAADALNYMALAGYDAETSMQMLPNVLNLAAAGGMELARASDMVTDAQTALGLSLEETSELVDMMAKTSSKSNTSVTQLGDAILTVGGTAKVLAGGTNELNTVLGVLADNGIKGSEAGTKLRNVILSLSAPTDKAAQELDALGVSTVDAQGNLKSLDEIMADLSASLEGLGSAERAEIINTIFNKQDIAAVNALLDTSQERYHELAVAIDGAWFSEKSLNDELGKYNINLQSSSKNVESMGITQKEFNEALSSSKGDAQAFVDSLVAMADDGVSANDILTGMNANLSLLQMGFDNAKGSAEAMADTQLDNLEGDITLFKSALEGAQIALSDSLAPSLRDFVQLGTEGLGALNTLFTQFDATPYLDEMGRMTQEGAKAQAENKKAKEEAMQALFDTLSNGLGMLTSLLPKAIDAGMQLLEAVGQGIMNNLPQIINTVVDIGVKLTDALVKAAPTLAKGAVTLVKGLAEALMNNKDTLIESGKSLVEMLWNGITEFFTTGLPELTTMATELMTKLGDTLKENIPVLLETGLTALMDFTASLRENAGLLVDAGLDMIMKIAEGLIEALPTMIETIPTIVSNIAGIINDNAPKLIATGIELIGKLIAGIVEAIPTLIAEFPKIVQAIFDVITAINWISLGGTIITGIKNGVTALATELPNTLKDIGTKAVEWLKTIQWSSLGRDIIDLIVIGIKALLTAIPNLLKSIGQSAVGALKSINWLELGKNIIAGIASGITGAAGMIKDAVVDACKNAWDSVKNFFDINSPSKKMAWAGEMLDLGLAKGIEKYAYLAEDAMKSISTSITDMTPQFAMAGNGNLTGGGSGYNQTINIYSPTALTPSEVARQTRNATRDMVLELRGKR